MPNVTPYSCSTERTSLLTRFFAANAALLNFIPTHTFDASLIFIFFLHSAAVCFVFVLLLCCRWKGAQSLADFESQLPPAESSKNHSDSSLAKQSAMSEIEKFAAAVAQHRRRREKLQLQQK